MEFVFRCNTTKCRVELPQQAVVTTCSHIFCLPCAETLGLSRPVGGIRICPACRAQLVNKDDAVVAMLDPTEDYKTSVLSGFTPTLIVECAERALRFYNYQATHEAQYQEHVARRMTGKVADLNAQLDDTIGSANSHIQKLQDALRDSQNRIEQLVTQQSEVQNAFKQKAKALTDVTRKYEQLKSEKMAAQTMNAASDEAEQMVQNMAPKHFAPHFDGGRFDGGESTVDMRRLHSMQQHPMPGRMHSLGITNQNGTSRSPVFSAPRANRVSSFNITGAPRASHVMTADGNHGAHHQPLGNLSANSFVRPANSGYGMSAGVKVGKQPLRTFASTPRTQHYADTGDLPMR